ncbi:hypothetical protein U27_03388 [Candidatus Vecturithrix granuli]|uniref:Uncharacterized protein n=1 Tax=Vecturithrix granuli TaxID=1499967 RepID=A0A081BVS1_VECG1|nr:hypothetical protein U27_03388 [Candidatus Vecturithrix granuli]
MDITSLCLDTNLLIEYLKGREYAIFSDRMKGK